MTRRQLIYKLGTAGALTLSRPGWTYLQDNSRDLVLRSETRLVLLDVSVKDRTGALVSGLSRSNFEVRENNVQQPITVFSNADVPVTVGILVDESRSMTPKRAEVLAAAEEFIKESNPQDQVFVLSFSETVKRGLPDDVSFSSDLEQLRRALHRAAPEGRTALYDAVVEGLKHLQTGRREKKALVVISDGGDTASTHTRREAMHAVESTSATVYSVGLFTPQDPDRDPGTLKQMSRISGGEAYFPESPSGMTAACRAIATDIRTRYTVGYIPKADDGKGAWRRIHVEVKVAGRPHLSARTRLGYRYEPEPTGAATAGRV
ncbi:MAG: VWA domain-containing protein [Acidobacteria bacterium]|nr:VWA domain-containing protein [Acidobacteriota bacterium]